MRITAIVTLALLFLFSCSGTRQKKVTETLSKEEYLTGTWQLLDGGFMKTFRFNPDMTGIETYSETEKFGYTWAIFNDRPRLIYNHNHDTLLIELNVNDSLIVVHGFKYRKSASVN